MNSQLSTQVGHPAESVHSFAKHTEESLASYLDLIIHQSWLIVCVAFLVSLCGVLYAYLATPQYESNLLVHVEEKGQREPKNILGEAGSMIDYKTPSAAEIELLRSRQVIARAIDRLKLYIEVKPKRFPIVGKVFPALGAVNYFPALQGAGGYAWGKEALIVSEFSVPPAFENRLFKVRALEQGSFQISESQSGLKKQGQVGQALNISISDGEISLLVEDIYASPGVEFELVRSSRLAIIESVQTSLTVNELGKLSGKHHLVRLRR
jgi:tyrosine-protein kinase Etk/Wzc